MNFTKMEIYFKMKIKELPKGTAFDREEFVDDETLLRFYFDDEGNTYSELWKRIDIEKELRK